MKKLSYILILAILITSFSFTSSFAANSDSLEEKIITAKSMFDIPEDYQLNHNVYTQGDIMVWNLRWENSEGRSDSISVSITDNNEIISYNKYTYKEYKKRLPSITLETARSAAEEFIDKINPDLLDELMYNEPKSPMNLQNNQYTFNYLRLVNNIPFKENNVYVSVDNETGEVINYNKHWYNNLDFPKPESIISYEEAKKAYVDKLGIRLCYSLKLENNELAVFPVYAPNYNNNSSVIDAFTGDKKDIYARYIQLGMAEELSMKQMDMDRSNVVITPQEQEKINEYNNLLSVEEAEKIARSIPVLNIDGYAVDYKNLNKNYLDDKSYIWNLSFRKKIDEQGQIGTANVAINANTGEVSSFYIYDYYEYDTSEKETKKEQITSLETAKKEVESFLESFISEKFKNIEYFENAYNYQVYDGYQPKQYTFNYIRKENGIEFLNNGISISYDAVRGKITSYRIHWNEIDTKDITKEVSLENAYNKLFNEIGLQLKYIGSYNKDKDVLKTTMGEINQVDLVYTLNDEMPAWIDAVTGKIIYNSGEEYVQNNGYSYSDIESNYAKKEIEILGNYMIGFEGGSFKPDKKIIQKDFFRLLVKVLDNYYEPYRATSVDDENMYKILIDNNILLQEEKSPDSIVSKEEACKYIIRAKRLEQAAKISQIFKTGFADEENINEKLIGYVALAKGLNLIEDNQYFKPKDGITRAQTAVMIYNYLTN